MGSGTGLGRGAAAHAAALIAATHTVGDEPRRASVTGVARGAVGGLEGRHDYAPLLQPLALRHPDQGERPVGVREQFELERHLTPL